MKLTRTDFNEYLRNYQPLPHEKYDPDDRRFRLPMHYFLLNHYRLWRAASAATPYFPSGPMTIVDLGPYPGSFLRFLRRLVPDQPSRLVGVGLMASDEFRRAMKESCGAEILDVNLDPSNDRLRAKNYPTRIPLEDRSVQFAFALEVVEHLMSPMHLLREAFRILAPRGHLLITTPNVSRIGNVIKLLSGRSNFDRLISDLDRAAEEWPPHFREYTLQEVRDLLKDAGFESAMARQFHGRHSRYHVRSPARGLSDLAKWPFYAVPHLRDNLLVVGRKPG
ncbi:MAG: class I SAM-dependent methyltransferase [Acidobacteriota bacterium]